MSDQKKTLSLSVKQLRKSGTVSDKDLESISVRLMEINLQKQVDEWRQKRRHFRRN